MLSHSSSLIPFVSAADLDAVFQRALTIALRSQDFVFHAYLYDWVISKDDGSELIEVSKVVERPKCHVADHSLYGLDGLAVR